MPASARKSSIGSRRTTQKYVPYRRDDLQHGKKTGIAVGYVDPRSDEFEPFEQVMSQADKRTPPRVQNARKKRTLKPKTPIREDVYDEDGEMSMELEESIPNSPTAYFANARIKSLTSSIQRVGSSSRPVARTSDVDFDKVPSPRPSAHSSRKSLPRVPSPRPSRLSQSTLTHQDDTQVDDGMDYGGPDFGGFVSDDDDEPPPVSVHQSHRKSIASSRRTSFTQMDQDEEEEGQLEDMDVISPLSMKAKGKQRANGDLPHQDMEEDIAQGLADVDQVPEDVEDGPQSRDNREDTPEERPAKKKKGANEGATKPRGRPRKENVLREVTPDTNINDGRRRGTRKRIPPLEWWRLEKYVYGRRESGSSLVPNIKYIRRLPKEEPQPLGGKRKRRPPRSKSKTVDAEDANLVFNPEEGWDDDTLESGYVIDYDNDEEVQKRLAFTAKMLTPKPAANHEFYFQKIFGDGDFIAAGQLIIPPNKQKPTKGTKDNTFVFYVIEGAVNFKVHRDSFVLTTGSMFLVPRGNMYYIQNISDRDAKLFFAQARKVSIEEEEARRSLSRRPESHHRDSGGDPIAARSSSGRASSELQPVQAAGAAALRRATSHKS
ncbi:Mif2/CENP-C like-domain-containing protein [Amylocystis lapponica]|nr:Mif2/CENP-C like-domain-containing protein [Amylocystis lapponica]